MLNWLFKVAEHQRLWEVRSLSYNLQINIRLKCLYFGCLLLKRELVLITAKAFLWKRLLTSPQWRQTAPTRSMYTVTESNTPSGDAWKWGPAAIQIHIRGVQDIWAAAALQRAQSSTFFLSYLTSFPMKLERNRLEFKPDGGSAFFFSGLISGYLKCNHSV